MAERSGRRTARGRVPPGVPDPHRSRLDSLASESSGRLIAVVEPDVVRAAVVHALGAGDTSFWRIDVRPLTATELSGRAGRWNVLLGRPLDSATMRGRRRPGGLPFPTTRLGDPQREHLRSGLTPAGVHGVRPR